MNFNSCAILSSLMAAVILMASSPSSAENGLNNALDKAVWKVRDVAADSKYYAAGKDGSVGAFKIELKREDDPKAPVWTSSCRVTSKITSDRAVTLALCVPLDETDMVWWDDPERSRNISGDKPFINQVDTGCGATGMASRYPIAVIQKGDRAYCLAVPIEPPRMVRFLYDPRAKEIRAEFDFGLSNVSEHFPSCADASVIAYEVPSKWAFRQALDRYYKLYPQAFKRRTEKGGIWLPFAPLRKIEKPEDFGFAFREAPDADAGDVKDDGDLGIDTYIYVEPQTYWRGFRGEGEKTYEGYMKQLWEDALNGDRKSQATLSSGIEREEGKYDLYMPGVAYTQSLPFGVNCDPGLSTTDWGTWPNKGQFEMEQLESMLQSTPGLDGVYVDSMEGWGEIKNFNRKHWKTSRYPLTFDPVSKKVCLYNFWGTYAFIKGLSEKLHSKRMLVFGNDAFFRHWYLAPYVDIPGREYSWFEGEKFVPLADSRFLYLRSMSAQKPYLTLMNDAFDEGKYMEEYFQRSMFYGVYPSMFYDHKSEDGVAYFYGKKWYNRDRPLFLKYIPMVKKLDLAGWQPVPYATANPEGIRIERFGDGRKGNLAFTLHNPTDKTQQVTLEMDAKDLHLSENVTASEWITGKALQVERSGDTAKVRLELAPNAYAAVGVK